MCHRAWSGPDPFASQGHWLGTAAVFSLTLVVLMCSVCVMI